MSRTLTASDRKALIRLASTLPKGSDERKAILAMDVILDVSSASRTVADIEKATNNKIIQAHSCSRDRTLRDTAVNTNLKLLVT